MLLLAAAGGVLSLGVTAAPAGAHPVDEYAQAAYLDITSTSVTVEVSLSPGPLVAAAVVERLDADRDGTIDRSEAARYGDEVAADVELAVDEVAVPLRVGSVDVPAEELLSAGAGTITVVLSADVPAGDDGAAHVLRFVNRHAPVRSVYQAANSARAEVELGTPARSADGSALTVTMRATGVASLGSAGSGTKSAAPSARSGASTSDHGSVAGGAGASLAGRLQAATGSPWAIAGLLLTAAMLGSLHALTPGHGKTLVAAYLVGSGGTAADAVVLGGVVTATHVSSVVVFGVAASAASALALPAAALPTLEVVAGLLVVASGLVLLARRAGLLGGGDAAGYAHTHPHSRSHGGHHHGHGQHDHHHHRHALPRDDHHDHRHGDEPLPTDLHRGALALVGAAVADSVGAPHTTAAATLAGRAETGNQMLADVDASSDASAEPSRPGRRSLIALGVSGGALPCPEALSVLLLAIGLHRIGLGVAVVGAFSLGLAAALVALGLSLVRTGALLRSRTVVPGAFQRWIPLVSAGVVILLGVAMTVRALGRFGPL